MPFDAASQQILPLNSNKDRFKAALVMATVACAGIAFLNHKPAPSAEQAKAQRIVSDACSPAGPYAGNYNSTGLDTSLAASALLQNPERTQKICAAVNNALSVAHQGAQSVDNSALYALTHSLGLDVQTARAAISQQAENENRLAQPEMLPAVELAPAALPAPSMEPNL